MAHDPARPEPFDDDFQYEQTREIGLCKTGETRMLMRRTTDGADHRHRRTCAGRARAVTRDEIFLVAARRVWARSPVGLQLYGCRVSIRRQLSNSFTTPRRGTV